MKKANLLFSLIMGGTLIFSCGPKTETAEETVKEEFQFFLEQFGDAKVMQFQVPGFDELTLDQKKLVYFLSEAALAGHDITYDQNYKHNLAVRRTCEAIVDGYKGDRETEEFKNFMIYTKKVWFSNGIHHNYSTDKFIPEISKEYFAELVKNSEGAAFPLTEDETIKTLVEKLTPIIFDKEVDGKRISLAADKDIITNSACNFYEGVTQEEVEKYYEGIKDEEDKTPISYGLNSKLVKVNGQVTEQVYKLDGMYGAAIKEITFWLEKAVTVAETPEQKKSLELLIEYYKTGDLNTWDDYSVAWVKDLNSRVDVVNGFIENYGDPMGMKSTWEAVVNFKDIEATKRAVLISDNAQWFEDNSPVDPRFKKKEVKGVSAKVITVAQLGGDCHPTTPIGINLPNADWIRRDHGSKSVTMENITYAYNKVSQGSGFLEEFVIDEEDRKLAKEHGPLAGNLHTDLHECLGHGSGQLLPGTSSEALKNYSSALEEARADLFALYYMLDPKMVELGLMPTLDVAKAEYNGYIRNGLMSQLVKIELGKDIEQAHMRNRQLIAAWCFEKGETENIIEKTVVEGKTYIEVNDHKKLRGLFGELLTEIQRIKSEGDFEAGKALVEKYAVKIDQDLHKEILDRYSKLKVAPYGGFVNPIFTPVMEGENIVDVKVEYHESYVEQMMDYAKNNSFLPTYN